MRDFSMALRKQHFFTFFAFIFLSILVGCGGGGGGSNPPKNPPSNPPVNNPPGNTTITANAGADRVVNAGEQVELKAGGTGNITGYSWSRTEGPSVTLTAVDFNAGWFTFIAPSTGAEPSVALTYRLRVSGAGGASAEDPVTFTIMRVNQAPASSAGSDQVVKGKATVTLSGSGTDSDGSIASYLWEQVQGDAVVINDPQNASASFSAPSTLEDITLKFRLTVTDNDGATDQKEVSILVTPENAPELNIFFPPAAGIFEGITISASGNANAVGADLVSVTLNAGAGPVTATLGADGRWHADNIVIPGGAESFELQAEVTDSVGRKSKRTSVLQNKGLHTVAIGSGPSWDETKGLAIDPQAKKAYVLTSGDELNRVGILPIDLETGIRGPLISDWANAAQGPQVPWPSHMIYHSGQGRLYVVTDNATNVDRRALISINPTTGERSVVSSNSRGTGDVFDFAIALAQGPGDTVLVSDNKAARVLQIDTLTGNRTTLVQEETATHRLQGLLTLAWSNNADNRLFALINSDRGAILNLNLNDAPVTSTLLTYDDLLGGSVGTGPGIAANGSDIVYDASNNRLLVLTRNADIVAVDLATGNRKTFARSVLLTSIFDRSKNMTFDADKQLLYVAGGAFARGLFVVNARTGHGVKISQ
jgi:hypothetical protein